jgi:hypothetical protein
VDKRPISSQRKSKIRGLPCNVCRFSNTTRYGKFGQSANLELERGLSGCKTFCIGSFQGLNGAIMQANKATDGREIGRNFDHIRMGANDLDNMSMGKICDKDQGAVCIPWRTLAERVMGFMEKYERSFHA